MEGVKRHCHLVSGPPEVPALSCHSASRLAWHAGRKAEEAPAQIFPFPSLNTVREASLQANSRQILSSTQSSDGSLAFRIQTMLHGKVHPASAGLALLLHLSNWLLTPCFPSPTLNSLHNDPELSAQCPGSRPSVLVLLFYWADFPLFVKTQPQTHHFPGRFPIFPR